MCLNFFVVFHSINSKLGQSDAADGVLIYHEKQIAMMDQQPPTTTKVYIFSSVLSYDFARI